MIATRNLILLFTMFVVTSMVQAQKLPNTQPGAIWAPANVKVDGDADDWNNQYQAYNKSVELFYTIANDDENIYLIIHAKKDRIIEKIIEGGISFTINGTKKIDDAKNLTVLFPLMPLPICKGALVSAGKSLTGKTMDNNHSDITNALDSIARNKQANSLVKANQQITTNLREIKVSGMDSITDTVPGVTDKTPYYRTLPLRSHSFELIGINNKDDIKAMVLFDKQGELTYELAIPLKYLKIIKQQKFFYNITINGRGEDGRPGNTWQYAPPPDRGILNQDMESPTDFWGEYTLAPKP